MYKMESNFNNLDTYENIYIYRERERETILIYTYYTAQPGHWFTKQLNGAASSRTSSLTPQFTHSSLTHQSFHASSTQREYMMHIERDT